jgi:hypothetical protein
VTAIPSTHKGEKAMSNTSNKSKLYRWILALTVAGMFVLLVSGDGGLQERLTYFAAVHDETDWTLA